MVTGETGNGGNRRLASRGGAGRPRGPRAGEEAERLALHHLIGRGLSLVAQNYRVARGPSARAGEIDLIMRERDGTLVFIEVRCRAAATHGGAAATVGPTKQRRLVLAARHFLLRWPEPPPCRFDVVAIDGERLQWIRGAFEAGS